MKTPIKMDDLGGNTPIFGNTHILPIGGWTMPPIYHLLWEAKSQPLTFSLLQTWRTPEAQRVIFMCFGFACSNAGPWKLTLLGQWLNFKLFGITYLVGKIKFKPFFFQGPLAE